MEFLMFATHQLRSSLAILDGYASMLGSAEAGPLSAKQKEIVDTMALVTRNLTKTVDEFLDCAKIEQGGFVCEMEMLDLKDMLEEVTRQMQIAAHAKQLHLSFETDASGSYHIFGDKEKLRTVLQNIVDNAIKYTEEGNVTVSLFGDANGVIINVSDTGIGIAPEAKPGLFEKFKRGPSSKMAPRGSGLGLYLAKEIVTAHHGSIRIDSDGLGKGSQVFIALPKVQGKA